MRRFLLQRAGFALCLLLLTSPFVQAQDIVGIGLSFRDALDIAAEQPQAIIQVQATQLAPISPNTGMPRLGQLAPETYDPRFQPLANLALRSNEYIDPRHRLHTDKDNEPILRERMCAAYQEQLARLFCSDFKNLYWSENALYMGLTVAAMAPIANTNIDRNFRNYYQGQNGGNRSVNRVALQVKTLGEYKYMLPAYMAFSLTGHLFPDSDAGNCFAQFGDRSLRATAIGAPMVGILQYGLGSGRPFTGTSRWHPFNRSNAASGHTFIGAVPFLTAASMTESRSLQALLIAGSFATGWSRIQTDDHYLSQVILGYTVAALAVHSVNQTEDAAARRVQFVPMVFPDGAGMGMSIRY